MKNSSWMVGILLAASVAVVKGAEDNVPELSAALERDLKVQGEYVGTADGQKWGAQVIALGKDEFRCVGFLGGLPGQGWDRGDERRILDGKRQGDRVVLSDSEVEVVISDGGLQVKELGGSALGTLRRVTRRSPTLGVKPPVSAVVLFDGTSVDHWENGKVLKVGGESVLAATGCESKDDFLNHRLHVEFQTPFVPEERGQGRGNSGVYVQGRYEVQVLDSFGLEGKDNECGGIYSIQQPLVNMCLPPTVWQTYDIDFTSAKYDAGGNKIANARITVRHNGVVIHDDLELTHGTPGRHPEGPGAEGLYLQDHGNPVIFRNVWVEKLP